MFDKTKYAELLSTIIFKTLSIKNYDVLAYQIMPNHLHLLTYNQTQAYPAVGALVSKWHATAGIPSFDGAGLARARIIFNISQLIHGIKSYYCDQIRVLYGINYPIFQPRFYSSIVDNQKYLKAVIYYIKHNPVEEKLPPKYHHPPHHYYDLKKIQNLFWRKNKRKIKNRHGIIHASLGNYFLTR